MKAQSKSLGASLLASVTALIPNLGGLLVLFSAGAGLAGEAWLSGGRPIEFICSPSQLVALAAGFYLAYVKRLRPRWNRVVLWIATILSALLWPLPYLLGWLR